MNFRKIQMKTEEEYKEIIILNKLAAFVDGEGTIGIYRHLTSSKKYSYFQSIRVANTDIRLIQWCVDNFGGSFPKPNNKGANRRDGYNWSLTGSSSYKLIKKIRPYLILKQEQADNAIELFEKVNKWQHSGGSGTNKLGVPDHKRDLAEDLYQRNKELNIRGKPLDEIEIMVPLKVRKDVLDEWLEYK